MNPARVRELVDQLRELALELDAEVPREDIQPASIVLKLKPGDNVGLAFQQLQEEEGGTILCQPGLYPNALAGITRQPGAPQVILTTDNSSDLPQPGERVTREHAPGLAIFSAPQGSTYTGQNGSRNLAFVAIGFGPVPDVSRTLVSLGGDRLTLKTLEDVPEDLDLDRVLFLGQQGRGQHRALQVHARRVRIRGCTGRDFLEVGRDSQAVACWNAGFDVEMDDCDWEGGAETLLIGGGDPASVDMIPARWRIRRTRFGKDPAWQELVNAKSYNIKCLVEHKCGIDFSYDGCVLEHAWPDDWAGGAGFVVKVTQANDKQASPWITTRGITLTNSIIRDVDRPFVIVGYGDGGTTAAPQPTERMRDLLIRNVLALGRMEGINCANPPDGLTIDHLTMLGTKPSFFNWWIDQAQPPGDILTWTNSILSEGRYGAKTTGFVGYPALQQAYTDVTFTANVIAGSAHVYPGCRKVLPEALQAALTPDYRLTQQFGIVTTDGTPVGADIDAINQAMK